MSRSSRRALALAASLLVALACAPRASTPPDRPRLAVVLIVDGLSQDRLIRWRPWLTSGLKRLLDEGLVATRCHYPHLNTETGPGHASLSTGAPPRVHGIATNQWYIPAEDGTVMRTVYCASEPEGGGVESSPRTIPGPGRLRVPTLGDRLLAADARAKVVSISIKDRSAILAAGRDRRAAAYWYGSSTGTFVTSAAYDDGMTSAAPVATIVDRFNREEAGARLADRFSRTWDRLPRPNTPRDAELVGGFSDRQDPKVGTGFPHDLSRAKKPYAAVVPWSPFADQLLADLTDRLLGDAGLGLGRDDVPDALWVSFSAYDYVAHDYGPDSEEAFEVLRALDRTIGGMLGSLDRTVGRGRAIVAVSSDHGFLALPESIPGGRRIDPDALRADLDAELGRVLGLPAANGLVFKAEACSLWLDRAALSRPGAPSVDRVIAILRSRLAERWGDAVLATFVNGDDDPGGSDDPIHRSVRNAWVPGRSGDLLVVFRPDVLLDPYAGKGSSHGSPHAYDTHVPLVLWGAGVSAGTLDGETTPYDLAPTLAGRLGVTLPDATGTALGAP